MLQKRKERAKTETAKGNSSIAGEKKTQRQTRPQVVPFGPVKPRHDLKSVCFRYMLKQNQTPCK